MPTALAHWSGSTVVKRPPHQGELLAGDRLILGAGFMHRFRVIIDVISVDKPFSLTLDARLPFGVVNHEVIVITAMSASSCRVTFN